MAHAATSPNRKPIMREPRFRVAAPLLAVLLACSAGDVGTRAPGADRSADAAAETAGAETAAVESGGAANPSAVATPAELIPIRVGGIAIEVELADEPAERQQGLMFRESLAEDQGMLFAYPEERILGFWMKNTLIPLDIAYINREGRIVDIKRMEPQSTQTHNSAAPAMYALEMNQGWFEANGIRVGDLIEF